MGRGDIKTKKGKIFAGSFGKKRAAKPPKKKAAPKESLSFSKPGFLAAIVQPFYFMLLLLIETNC